MKKRNKVRKCVFPVAGLGTRFLPATKDIPKEMLPLLDKPVVHYGVEEAVASGINQILFITGRGKRAIEDYFDRSPELEYLLEERGKKELLEKVQSISDMAEFVYVRQKQPLGLGHAVMMVEPFVTGEPIALVLADDVILSDVPVLEQLIKVYERYGGSVVALEEIPVEDVSRYGVVAADKVCDNVYRISAMVEKPKKEEAPSNLAIIGRYILSPAIFEKIHSTQKGAGGEIQLTDAIRDLMEDEPVWGVKFTGTRLDCGTKEGFVKATIYAALQDPELRPLVEQMVNGNK